VQSDGEPAAMVLIGTADLWRELVRLVPARWDDVRVAVET
jgi:hypothetical protein